MTSSIVKIKETDIQIIDGDRGVNYPKKSDFFATGHCLFLDASNVTKNGFQFFEPQFISQQRDDLLGKGKLNRHDIVLTTRGTIGNFGYFGDNIPYNNMRINSGMLIIRNGQDFNTKYLYQLLKSKFIKSQISNITTGSSQPQLTKTIVHELSLFRPPLATQEAIAKVLSGLDDKIALNNKISSELEQVSRLIYNYWFTQFDFPNKQGKPYRNSKGAMVYSNQLKREIPAGWSTKKLDEIISRSGTGLNPRDNFKLGNGSNYYVTIKSVENGKVVLDERCDKIDDKSLSIIQKRSDLQVGDILFTSIQPVGVTYLIQEKPINWNINESVFTLRPNYEECTSEFLYMLLSGQEMKCFTENSSAGSVHKGIRHSILKEFKFAYPDKNIIDQFTEIVRPMLRTIYNNDEENRKLEELRDWLLPMIINEQVKVA